MRFKAKNRNCKCNHMKFDHEKRFMDYKECTKCNCSSYLRRDFPTKSDKVFAIAMSCMIVYLIATVPYIYYESMSGEYERDMIVHEKEDGTPETLGNMLDTMILIYGATISLYVLYFGSLLVLPVFFNKRKVRD